MQGFDLKVQDTRAVCHRFGAVAVAEIGWMTGCFPSASWRLRLVTMEGSMRSEYDAMLRGASFAGDLTIHRDALVVHQPYISFPNAAT